MRRYVQIISTVSAGAVGVNNLNFTRFKVVLLKIAFFFAAKDM